MLSFCPHSVFNFANLSEMYGPRMHPVVHFLDMWTNSHSADVDFPQILCLLLMRNSNVCVSLEQFDKL